jgi:hypothetical protein
MSARLQKRRSELIGEIEGIRRLRRGQISEQYIEKPDAEGKMKRYGPYYVWQATIKGKKRSVRVARQQVDAVREDIVAHQRFKELCEELVDVTEQLTRQEPVRDSKKNSRKCAKRSARS